MIAVSITCTGAAWVYCTVEVVRHMWPEQFSSQPVIYLAFSGVFCHRGVGCQG